MKKILLLLLILTLSTICTADRKRLSDADKVEKIKVIEKYLNELATNDEISGAILIAKEGEVLLKKAFGYAHLGHRVKNKVNTKFNYASMGKSFTAVAIFQLIQAGQLSLTDTVGQFLPDYPNQVIKNSVTIQHLLTHTSGVPNYFMSEEFLESSKASLRTLQDLSPLYENKPMESKPGEMFSYRNTNYIILGRIIEKLTGVSYEAYIEEHIFSAKGMNDTGNYDVDHVITNAAEGYTQSDLYPGKYQLNTFMGSVRGSSAGGGFTTLDDMYKFTEALNNNELLDNKHTKLFTTPVEKKGYGFGMQFADPDKGTIFGHSGGHYGVAGEWRIYADKGYTVIVLTNRDADKGFLDIRNFIQAIITGATTEIET